MSAIFWAKTCSRQLGRVLTKHEERWIRVLQLGQRVTVLVDVGPVGEPTTCTVCGSKALRVYDGCSTGHNVLNKPYCREHHPDPIARWVKGHADSPNRAEPAPPGLTTDHFRSDHG